MKAHPPIAIRTDGGETSTVFPNVQSARSFTDRAFGFMFRFRMNHVLLFTLGASRCWITNLFVFRALDLVFLDRNWIVLHIHTSFRPFTPLYRSPPGSAYLIEVPHTLRYDLNVGDQLCVSRTDG